MPDFAAAFHRLLFRYAGEEGIERFAMLFSLLDATRHEFAADAALFSPRQLAVYFR